MHHERMQHVRAIMREQGLDVLVLLGNTNVAYATGAIWPLADSGRANFEQPVAVVLLDDEWPHFFSPVREGDRLHMELPSDHIHGPVYLDFDEEFKCSHLNSQASCRQAPWSRSTSGHTHCAASGPFTVRVGRTRRWRTGDRHGQGDQDT